MNEARCPKCNKKLGESPNDIKIDSASCDKEEIIYKTRCPRCNADITIAFSTKDAEKEEKTITMQELSAELIEEIKKMK